MFVLYKYKVSVSLSYIVSKSSQIRIKTSHKKAVSVQYDDKISLKHVFYAFESPYIRKIHYFCNDLLD